MEWIIMATERQERPVFPEGYCPFDPGASAEIPPSYQAISIPNKFPSLRPDAPEPPTPTDGIFRTAPARGACEIVLYSQKHDRTLGDEPVNHIRRVVDLWQERYVELGGTPGVEYVFIFENRGPEIGVTLPHPHGQIYAYPFIPPVIERRLKGSRAYFDSNERCLYCDILEEESRASPSRVVVDNEYFTAIVPFWAKWSYELNIYPKRHITGLDEMRDDEKTSLAGLLKAVLWKYDALFGFRLPFIMAIHQRPTGGAEGYDHCHLSIDFYPPHRSRDKLKYQGGSETGAGAHINVTSPEVAAEELRRVNP